MNAERSRDTSNTNARIVIIALGASVAALLLFGLAEKEDWIPENSPLQSVISQVAGLLFATGILAAAWEMVGRRQFAREVLSTARLGADVTTSGITRVTDQYLEDVEWADLFAGTKQLDVVVAYARTWRHAHEQRLRTVARKAGNRVRVFLPDPDDEETVKVLAYRFTKGDVDEVRRIILQAIEEFASYGDGGKGEVEIYVRPGDVVYSCYRFDSRAVLTMYSHSKNRRSVPTFEMKGGNLYQFVQEEIDSVLAQSRRVFPH